MSNDDDDELCKKGKSEILPNNGHRKSIDVRRSNRRAWVTPSNIKHLVDSNNGDEYFFW